MNRNTSKEIALSSCDHFQLLFDYKIKREKGTANTSQLLIELDSVISLEKIKRTLEHNDYFTRLNSTVLLKTFFGKEKYLLADKKAIHIEEIHRKDIVASEVYGNDNIGSDSVKVTLIQLPENSVVLFQFNHIFIDNAGVKNLLRSFRGEEYSFFRTNKDQANSFFKRLKSTIAVSLKMMKKWYEPKAFIDSTSQQEIKKEYIITTLSKEETMAAQLKIERSHHIQSMSSVLMATCCLSVKELLDGRNQDPREFVLQQPFDLTPKKSKPYILGNRFSFIHYRLKPDQINALSEIQNALNKQTIDQIRDKMPQRFLELESVLRLVNLRFHLWMISLPAKGKMTSFAYSFVDETKVIDEFAGSSIKNITNIPPVMRKPPVTFGFVYYDGCLRIQVCYDARTVSKDEATQLHDNIIKRLMN